MGQENKKKSFLVFRFSFKTKKINEHNVDGLIYTFVIYVEKHSVYGIQTLVFIDLKVFTFFIYAKVSFIYSSCWIIGFESFYLINMIVFLKIHFVSN